LVFHKACLKTCKTSEVSKLISCFSENNIVTEKLHPFNVKVLQFPNTWLETGTQTLKKARSNFEWKQGEHNADNNPIESRISKIKREDML